jgi:hypothetical protein
MNKDELLKELQKLKDEDYSNDALFNDGYRTSMMDAIDLVKKLNIDDVSKCDHKNTRIMTYKNKPIEVCEECSTRVDVC